MWAELTIPFYLFTLFLFFFSSSDPRYDKLPDWVEFPDVTLDKLLNQSNFDSGNFSFAQPDYVKLFEDKKYEAQMMYKPENYSRNMDESLIGTVEVFGLKAVISNLEPFVEYIIEVCI